MAHGVAHFETLYWIARLGSFHAAAAQLGISQPTVSLRIKEWERELGLKLFKRAGRSVVLSEDGATVLEYAERILGLVQDLDHRVARPVGLRGLLRFGVPDTFALLCLPTVLNELEARHPELKVAVTVENSRVLSRRLDEGALDVAVLSEPPRMRNIRLDPLGRHECVWVAAPGLLLPRQSYVPQDLADLRIFTNPAPSNTFAMIMDWFGEHGLVPGRISTCNSIAVILTLVRARAGISAVPQSIVIDEVARGDLVLLNAEPSLPAQNIFIASVRTATHPAIPVLSALIRDVVTQRPFLDGNRAMVELRRAER